MIASTRNFFDAVPIKNRIKGKRKYPTDWKPSVHYFSYFLQREKNSCSKHLSSLAAILWLSSRSVDFEICQCNCSKFSCIVTLTEASLFYKVYFMPLVLKKFKNRAVPHLFRFILVALLAFSFHMRCKCLFFNLAPLFSLFILVFVIIIISS